MGDSNTLTVSTEFGEIVVHKMVLADFAELLRALDKLPKKLGGLFDGKDVDFKSMDNATILKLIPDVLADSFEDIAGLLAVSTDKDTEFLLKLDAADSIDVLDAILELNDFVRIANAVKKMLARRAKIQKAPAQPAPQK